jgi:hypothetical protein
VNLTTQTVFLKPDGSFELIDPNPATGGSRVISTKFGHWLRKNVSLNTASGSVNVGNVVLTNGDVDGDNAVSILDYIKLSGWYELDSSSVGWNTADGDGVRPRDADLDEDGQISILDYLILSSSFGIDGDSDL